MLHLRQRSPQRAFHRTTLPDTISALELQIKKDPQPELIPNEDQESINLEHVLPENPASLWDVDDETALVNYRRLGNLVLLQATPNSVIGNLPFKDKKAALKASSFFLTKMVAENKAWTTKEINIRQRRLAELAVETWPLTVR